MNIGAQNAAQRRMDHKVFIVFGGATGHGEALSRSLVELGATVVIADIDEAAGHSVADKIGLQCRYRRVDILDLDDHVTSVEASLARYGRLDGLIYWVCAGDYVIVAEPGVTDEAIRASIDSALPRLDALIPNGCREVLLDDSSVRLFVPSNNSDSLVLEMFMAQCMGASETIEMEIPAS